MYPQTPAQKPPCPHLLRVSKGMVLGGRTSPGSPQSCSLSLSVLALPAPYLVPAVQFPGFPDLWPSSWLHSCLTLWLHAPTICGFLAISHLGPPSPADIQTPSSSPNTKSPASPVWPPTGKQASDSFIWCSQVVDYRGKSPFTQAQVELSPEQEQGLLTTYSWERSVKKEGSWCPHCIEGCAKDGSHTGEEKFRCTLASFPCLTNQHSLKAQRECSIVLMLIINSLQEEGWKAQEIQQWELHIAPSFREKPQVHSLCLP